MYTIRCGKVYKDGHRILSKVGKEVLLKSAAQAVPNYVMCIFLRLEDLCFSLEKLVDSVWWVSGGGQSNIRWLRWDPLCNHKENGELNFMHLHDFNIAILAKQGRRLCISSQLLVAKVYKAFPSSLFLEVSLGASSNYTSQSIWEARPLLLGGCHVGFLWDVKLENGLIHSCLIQLPYVTTPPPVGVKDMLVKDLLAARSSSLDVEKVESGLRIRADCFRSRMDIKRVLVLLPSRLCQ